MFKSWFCCFDHNAILGYYGTTGKEATIVLHGYVGE